jgi:formyltetrahydrofolate deformylase
MEKNTNSEKATLLLYCPDVKGIVLTVSEFIFKNGGNVIDLEQHLDAPTKIFFMRVHWDLNGFSIPEEKISEYFKTLIAEKYQMTWSIQLSNARPKMALFVTKLTHCLYDILGRWKSNDWQVDIPVIISNHENLKIIAEQFGIEFHYLPITKENKKEQEVKQLQILEKYNIDFVVLARYMQIISPEFIEKYENKIINIHHSFLPAFPGAKPYHSAFERGVKIIGATSHYVTSALDQGPIIEQDIVRISHKNKVEDLIRKGQDLEKLVLSRAIFNHIQQKVLVYNNKTVVFS